MLHKPATLEQDSQTYPIFYEKISSTLETLEVDLGIVADHQLNRPL